MQVAKDRGMVKKLSLLAVVIVALAGFAPSQIANAATLNSVTFRLSSRFGGSLIVDRCVSGRWNWLTSTELEDNTNNPNNDHPLGAWKWRESGCRSHYAVTGIGDLASFEIGIGTSDDEPTGDLYVQPGTDVYQINVTYGKITDQSRVRTVTSSNSWCPRGNCTHADPGGTPCEADAQSVRTATIFSDADRRKMLGIVKLVWSPGCNAIWGKVSVDAKGGITKANFSIDMQFLHNRRGGEPFRFDDSGFVGYMAWTNMASQNVADGKVCASINVVYTKHKGSACVSYP